MVPAGSASRARLWKFAHGPIVLAEHTVGEAEVDARFDGRRVKVQHGLLLFHGLLDVAGQSGLLRSVKVADDRCRARSCRGRNDAHHATNEDEPEQHPECVDSLA